jgi:glycosyltransferase involved in cell wall biosynthesis
LLDTEVKFARGQAVMEACLQMRSQGYSPDVVIAHPGWGESLFVKAVWPGVRLGLYAELYYQAEGADMGFDPEFSTPGVQDVCRIQGKNINNLVHAELADGWLSPTRWQADTFPARIRERITVAHDGIDTARLVPNPNAYVTLNGQRKLAVGDEVITFVNRNLEPYRGYHSFMRALPLLQQMRPNARVVIVGADRVTARGDVCNKIGTYLKALAAHDNGVPFYVALPLSTLDRTVHDGVAEIPIEHRSPREVTHIIGRDAQGGLTEVQLVPDGSPALNPAFDVTPARLVTGLITEQGVLSATAAALAAAGAA